jgi:hypothetical protein
MGMGWGEGRGRWGGRGRGTSTLNGLFLGNKINPLNFKDALMYQKTAERKNI